MFSAVAFVLFAQNGQVQDQDVIPRIVRERSFQLKDLMKVDLKIDEKHSLKVWVMDEEAKRQEGMMFLKDSDFTEKQGMIFVFKNDEPLRFWMKNTYVPLDIAYISANGSINTIYTMKAFDTYTDYSSKKDSKYALEVKSGLFSKLGVKEGMKVSIPSEVKAKD